MSTACLVNSPHYAAWRDALRELMASEWADIRDQTTYAPDRFTEDVYQRIVAGRPRLDGARAALDYFGVPDADRRPNGTPRSSRTMTRLITSGQFEAYPDALRLVLES